VPQVVIRRLRPPLLAHHWRGIIYRDASPLFLETKKIKGTMKILIEIPSKFIEIVKGIMLGACDSEDDEKELYEAVEIATKAEDPIGVDFSRILDKNAEERAQYSQLMMSLAALALAQIKMPPPEEKKSGLAERLEAMQKQAEDLQRKRMEGKL
jgi:hypothetical protein